MYFNPYRPIKKFLHENHFIAYLHKWVGMLYLAFTADFMLIFLLGKAGYSILLKIDQEKDIEQ